MNTVKEKVEIEKRIGRKKVKLECDGYGMYLFTMRNGSHWNGMAVDDELLDMILEVVNEYKSKTRGVK